MERRRGRGDRKGRIGMEKGGEVERERGRENLQELRMSIVKDKMGILIVNSGYEREEGRGIEGIQFHNISTDIY